MIDHNLLTKLYSPCGKYSGFFEDGKSPSDWTVDKVYRISSEEFKGGFYWYDGSFQKKFEDTYSALKEKYDCHIVFEDVLFTEQECLKILENALVNDLEEATSFSSYTPWENLFNLKVFLEDTVKEYGIKVEIEDFNGLMVISEYGSYSEIISHSISDFRSKMKGKLSFV